VTGALAEGRSPLDLLRGCFPGGSITGAPKVRAMEIIEELEPTRRGLYGGAAGYIGWGGRSMDLCIAIRTLLAEGGAFHVQAGAGIVYDSVAEREYEETRSKARAVLRAIGAARAAFGGSGS
jgi:anthranilate synthase component 1